MSGTDNPDPTAVSFRPDMLQTGMFFATRFRIVHSLGQGAMGKVYLASDLMLGEGKIALKILSSDLENDPVHLARFLREVQLTRQVTHPGVVRTFDIGHHNDCHYFTMEYVEGKTLAQSINGKPCQPEKCIDILTQLCEGLCAIHELGIVHRDLKSSNVLITNQGQVKIADFGIARPDVSNLTVPDELVGSATHMAPEVWKQSEISQSSDLYSLGVIAYELLTGILPFEGKTAYSMMWKHLKEQPINPSNLNADIPAWLANLCLKLLSKDANNRPQSARKVLEILKSTPKVEQAQTINKDRQVAKTAPIKAMPSIDIWSPVDPGTSNATQRPVKEKSQIVQLVRPDEKLIKESIQIADYNLSSSLAKEFSLRDPYIRQIMLSIVTSVLLVALLIEFGHFVLPFSWPFSLDIQGLGNGLSQSLSVGILSTILLIPFFLICSIMQGVRFGIRSLSKLCFVAIAIFLLIFASKLILISQASSDYNGQTKSLKASAALNASLISFSEVLMLQTSPTIFDVIPAVDQEDFKFEISRLQSNSQVFAHILYITIILISACVIICNVISQKISYFRKYFLCIPLAMAFSSNWIFAKLFADQNLGWILTIGDKIIFIVNYSVFSALFIWGSILACALATQGWRIKVK